MSQVFRLDDTILYQSRVCFVKQPHNEIGIRANAKDIQNYYGGSYPCRNSGKPPVTEWLHPWKPEEGHIRLRLGVMNGDAKSFCNFNINPGNDSDTSNLSEDESAEFLQSLKNEEVQKTIDELVDSPPGKSFSECILQLAAENKIQIVRTDKWVFCRLPNKPSQLLSGGIEKMTKWRRPVWHHYSEKEDTMREGLCKTPNKFQVPCIDLGGISKVDAPLNQGDEATVFTNPNTCKICPFEGMGHEAEQWVLDTINTYLKEKQLETIKPDRFAALLKSLGCLF